MDDLFDNLTKPTLVTWRKWEGENPKLAGHCDINFGGITILGIPVFLNNDGTWAVGVPATPKLDGEGRVKLRYGRAQYFPVIGFETDRDRERWTNAVLGALMSAGIYGG
jgi:hypothetical protein